jgi:DNA-binding CsgD family transcriptional regulator
MSMSRALGSFLTGTHATDPAAAALLSRRTVSHHTVHRHVANIGHKLGSGSRAAAVAEAVRLGLL